MNTRLPAAQRRQQLLDVAVEIFGVGGYGEASVADIAAAAGVTKPVVYQHFDSKRALFLEVLRECSDRMQDQIEKATAEASSPREQVEEGFGSMVRYFHDNPAAFRILFSDVSRSDPEFAHAVHRVEMVVADRIADLIVIEDLTAEERRVLAHGVLGMAEGVLRNYVDNPDVAVDRVADLLSTLAWTGLRGSG